MGIDDKMQKLVDQLGLEGEIALQNEALQAAISSLPYMGAALSSLWAGQARRRLVERLVALFSEVKRRLDSVDASIIDEAFFDSEEFQTILALAIDQLQFTHDQRKISMLAAAMANSGAKQRAGDHRKELFVRLLRDLTAYEVAKLAEMRPQYGGVRYKAEVCDPHGEALLAMQTLSARGLVQEFLRAPEGTHLSGGTMPEELLSQLHKLQESISKVSARCFRISDFGEDFLGFIGEAGDSTP